MDRKSIKLSVGSNKRKSLRDANQKCLLNPFMLFCREVFTKAKLQNKDMDLKKCGLKWDVLSTEDKEKYVALYEENKKKFQEEKRKSNESKKLTESRKKKADKRESTTVKKSITAE